MEVYSYKNGIATTEQNLLLALDDFLTSDLNWVRVDTVSDTSSNRDYVWRSLGDATWQSVGGDPIFIRIRATDDYWYCYGYRTYTASDTYTFQLYDSTNTRVDLSNVSIRYWFYGNDNFVCCLFKDPTTEEPVVCYLGLIRSYFSISKDDYPMLIKGSSSQTYSWYDQENAYMHECTSSGAQTYEGFSWWNWLQYDSGNRVGCFIMLPLVLVNTNASSHEMRGEPYGVYQVNGYRLPTFGAISTPSGVFLTMKFDQEDGECNAFGPVSASEIGFDMWDDGDIYA